MSPAKTITVDGETRLQLTTGSAFALIGTLLVHGCIIVGFIVYADRRVGAIENAVVRLSDKDVQHDRSIDRLESRLFPTATITGDRK